MRQLPRDRRAGHAGRDFGNYAVRREPAEGRQVSSAPIQETPYSAEGHCTGARQSVFSLWTAHGPFLFWQGKNGAPAAPRAVGRGDAAEGVRSGPAGRGERSGACVDDMGGRRALPVTGKFPRPMGRTPRRYGWRPTDRAADCRLYMLRRRALCRAAGKFLPHGNVHRPASLPRSRLAAVFIPRWRRPSRERPFRRGGSAAGHPRSR